MKVLVACENNNKLVLALFVVHGIIPLLILFCGDKQWVN